MRLQKSWDISPPQPACPAAALLHRPGTSLCRSPSRWNLTWSWPTRLFLLLHSSLLSSLSSFSRQSKVSPGQEQHRGAGKSRCDLAWPHFSWAKGEQEQSQIQVRLRKIRGSRDKNYGVTNKMSFASHQRPSQQQPQSSPAQIRTPTIQVRPRIKRQSQRIPLPQLLLNLRKSEVSEGPIHTGVCL